MTELLVLGGERVEAADGATDQVIEPATAAPMAEVAKARRRRRPARGRHRCARVRGRCLAAHVRARARSAAHRRRRSLIRERQEELATLEARNGGKPIGSARAEIDIVANVFEYWGGAANKIAGETIPVVPPGLDVTLREPVGVCALITPWNFPAVIASWKIAPALACGNTAVVKPASQTPLTALAIAEILYECGLPEGTLERPSRAGVDHGGGADRRPSRGEDLVHGFDRGRRERDAGGRDEHHARLARARRQVGERRLRRRRPRRLHREVPLVGVRQRGPGLLRAIASTRAAGHLRRVRRAVRRAHRRRSRSASRSTRPPRWAR